MTALLAPLPFTTLSSDEMLATVLASGPSAFARLQKGATVLFAGCGAGATLTELAQLFPRSRFFATERSPVSLDLAREAVLIAGLQNTRVGGPVLLNQPSLQGSFDFIIREGGEAAAPMDAMPELLRDGGLLFDLAHELPSLSDYHDTGLVILRSLRLSDSSLCVIAGNWTLHPPAPHLSVAAFRN